jgi:hypothetical protein
VPRQGRLGSYPADVLALEDTGFGAREIAPGLITDRLKTIWISHRRALLGVAALLAWAHPHCLVVFYAAFALAGLAMAATLCEPAFAVPPPAPFRAPAVLVLTIAGGLSSTVCSSR